MSGLQGVTGEPSPLKPKKKQEPEGPEDKLVTRGLPANQDAERSVLGAIMLDNGAYEITAGILLPEDFSVCANARLFRHMAWLRAATPPRPIDFVTLTEELLASKELDVIGGVEYLSKITDGLPRSTNAEHYARIIKDHAIRRAVIHVAHDVVQAGLERDQRSGMELNETAIEGFQAIARGDTSRVTLESIQSIFMREFVTASGVLDYYAMKHSGLRTGLLALDNLTGGLYPGELTVIGANTSMGKTALMCQIAKYVAEQGRIAAVFSMEMLSPSIIIRMICSESEVNIQAIRKGFIIDKAERARIMDACARLTEENRIYFDESTGLTWQDVASRARRVKRERGDLGLIVVDYLQLMGTRASGKRQENRNNEISEITRGLKNIAGELGCPILLGSQLNRENYRRPKPKPMLADLRDSGSIEQDANNVLFIWRQDKYEMDTGTPRDMIAEEKQDRAEIIVAKQRNGPLGIAEVSFTPKYATFGNCATTRADIAERHDDH